MVTIPEEQGRDVTSQTLQQGRHGHSNGGEDDVSSPDTQPTDTAALKENQGKEAMSLSFEIAVKFSSD